MRVMSRRDTPLRVRTSARHWSQLSTLLSSFERIMEQAARLDAYRPPNDDEDHGGRRAQLAKGRRHAQHVRFDHRVRVLTARVDAEIDRVTAEMIVTELQQKQTRHGSRVEEAA